MRYLNIARNVEGLPGQSSWDKRHGAPFKGMLLPLGVAVDFTPSPIHGGPGKFEPRSVPGVFLGCHEQPGGRFSGDYLVAKLTDFKSGPYTAYKKTNIHRVKEFLQPNAVTYPLKAAWDAYRSRGPALDTGRELPPPPPVEPPPSFNFLEPEGASIEEAPPPEVEETSAPKPADSPPAARAPLRIAGRGDTNDPTDYPKLGVYICPGGPSSMADMSAGQGTAPGHYTSGPRPGKAGPQREGSKPLMSGRPRWWSSSNVRPKRLPLASLRPSSSPHLSCRCVSPPRATV